MANNFDLKKYLKEGKLNENEYKVGDLVDFKITVGDPDDRGLGGKTKEKTGTIVSVGPSNLKVKDTQGQMFIVNHKNTTYGLRGKFIKEGKLHENEDNMPWYISTLLQTVKDGELSPEDVNYLINQLKLSSKKEGTPSDSNISKESIISKANSTDAEGFQQFLEDNDITHEWNEVTVDDYNNGVYDVYLDDFDMPVRYISGKYSPEEDM